MVRRPCQPQGVVAGDLSGPLCLQRALEALRKRGLRDAAIVQMTPEGLRLFDSMTEEPIDRLLLSDITFSAAVSDAQHQHIFGIIAKSPTLGLTAVHIFEMDARGVKVRRPRRPGPGLRAGSCRA